MTKRWVFRWGDVLGSLRKAFKGLGVGAQSPNQMLRAGMGAAQALPQRGAGGEAAAGHWGRGTGERRMKGRERKELEERKAGAWRRQ